MRYTFLPLEVHLTSAQRTLWFALAVAVAGTARAAVPPEIAKQLVEIGRGVCVPETAQIYRPLHPNPPYLGLSITRDISFGPDPKNVLDVFSPEKGSGSLPVLIYVSGGAGNKQQGGPNGDVFYDIIMLWAVKNGMVGVNMQRRPGETWDDPAKDIAKIVQWVHQNIAKYKGNTARVFIWCQSAGNIPVSTYVGHPELYGPEGVGIKGVVFMSAPAFDILPAKPPAVQGGFQSCGQPAGRAANTPPAAGRGLGGRGGKQNQIDEATLLSRSNLPGLIKSNLPFLVSVAELDPPAIIAFAETLRDELCKANRCPTYVTFKNHSHISEVMSADTSDTSVTGPILEWINSVK
jgi:hypothetical protein